MKKTALFGDSFGYQFPTQDFSSWVEKLGNHYVISNHCQAGVSEYKILQQIKSADLGGYDQIIITHTSPSRVFVRYNPLHEDSITHQDCDIILADIENRKDRFSKACHDYFKFIFDFDHALDIHNMICQEIHQRTEKHNVVHMTHFDYTNCFEFPNLINFHALWLKNRGPVNHYNQFGNNEIYKTLLAHLQQKQNSS
jgi:hypothetical protein